MEREVVSVFSEKPSERLKKKEEKKLP